jgi:hypothetical protein
MAILKVWRRYNEDRAYAIFWIREVRVDNCRVFQFRKSDNGFIGSVNVDDANIVYMIIRNAIQEID